MKTFEERYTAWIDNTLEGPALTSFELELSRRAAAGEARADKEDAARLRFLLATHLQAPAMTNAEFFSHQLRERIDAERSSDRRREEARHARGSIFSWPFARLAGLSAATLFVAVAIYYGMMPPHTAGPSPQVAINPPAAQAPASGQVGPSALAPDSLAANSSSRRAPGSELALASPAPPRVDLNANIQVFKSPVVSDGTSATPLQYKDSNVNNLWINGLDEMTSVPGESSASSSAPAEGAKP